jgi:hypothetical protein
MWIYSRCQGGSRGLPKANIQITSCQTKALVATCPDIAQLAPQTFGRIPATWPNDMMPVPGLRLFQGWECSLCECKVLSQADTKCYIKEVYPNYSYGLRVYQINLIRPVAIQTWFQTMPGGGGIWWRVSNTGPAPPIYLGLPQYNRDIRLCKHYRQFLLATIYSQLQIQPLVQSLVLSEIPTNAYPIPEYLLAEPSIAGMQRKDDASRYVQQTNWPKTFA